jgi:hypothetical protein
LKRLTPVPDFDMKAIDEARKKCAELLAVPDQALAHKPYFAGNSLTIGDIPYLLADLAMGIGIFRWYYQLHAGIASGIYDGFAAQAVTIGVWGRAALLPGVGPDWVKAAVTNPVVNRASRHVQQPRRLLREIHFG